MACKLGVSRVWVAEDYRRQGIATRMTQAMLADAVYGEVINRTHVAFSQPTAEGKHFGTHFFGTPTFNIYTP
jgi:N-acetyltransferase